MSVSARTEDRMKPWEMSWNGRTWHEMPGQDFEIKKMNFYLFRTGHLKLEDVQYIGLDDVVRTRTVTVMPVSFGRAGMALGLEQKAAREAAHREELAECAEVERRRARLRLRLGVMKNERGALRQLALTCGVYYDCLLKFVRTGMKLGEESLRRVEEKMEEIREGRCELRLRKRTVKELSAPAGHVPFKAFLAAAAARAGMQPHSFYVRLKRDPKLMPPILKLHGRSWWVPTTAMPEEVAA